MNNRHIKGKYGWIKHFDFILLDIIAVFISLLFAFTITEKNFDFLYDSSAKSVFVIAIMVDLVVILFSGPYSGIFRRSGSEELLNCLVQAIYNFIFVGVIFFILGIENNYSHLIFLLTYIFFFCVSLLFRLSWKSVLSSGKATSIANNKKTIFIVSDKKHIDHVLTNINSSFLQEFKVEGICVVDGIVGETIHAEVERESAFGKITKSTLDFVNSSTLDGFVDYILDKHIDEVFIDIKPSAVSPEAYKTLVDNGKGIHMSIFHMIGFKTDDQFITNIGTYKALSVGVYSFTGKQLIYMTVKRLFDVFFGLLGLIVLLPLMLVVKISFVVTGDYDSIFYSQTRVGLNGSNFKLFKFRSMVNNSKEILEELLKDENYRKEWEANQKFENDPRITKMGKILRKTSLDEIPQFLNILKGDMSLIGPRPLVVGELELHNGLQLYNQVKPGITGWWGCNGRSNTTYDERLDLEYFYVKHCSLYMDLLCIIKTIAVIIRQEGAK